MSAHDLSTLRAAAQLIKQHERAIGLLETIKCAENRRQLYVDSLNQFGYQFPRLRDKYSHEIEIITAAIERLWMRYSNLITKLN